MKEPNYEKQMRTRNGIISALTDLAEEKPVSSITVNQICDRAGIHRSTFYRYFETVEIMIRTMEDEFLESYERFCNDIDFSIGPTLSSRESFKNMIMFYADNKETARFLLFRNEDRAFFDKYVSVMRSYYIKFMEDSGVWFEGPNMDYYIDYAIGGTVHCLRQFLDGKYSDIEGMLDFMFELGIANPRKEYVRSAKRRKKESL